MALKSIGGSDGILNGLVGTETDKKIESLNKTATKVESDLEKQFEALDKEGLKESDKQKILNKIQAMHNLLERINALISNMLESAQRTMMGIIQKIGS